MSEQDEGARIESLSALSQKVDRLTELVQSVVGGAHKDATTTTQEKLDQPGSIAEEVQRELSRRDDAAKAAEREAMLGKHDEAIKAMQEKAPEPPPRRVERVMGWGR